MARRTTLSLAQIEAAYRAHGHHVLRRAIRLLGSESEAQEVAHDVFVNLLGNPGQFGARSSLATWLYTVTTHMCLNRLRNARNRGRLVEEAEAALPRPSVPAQAEDVAALRDVLARLPPDLAEVAVYHYGDEMTQEEIADALGCSRRRVGSLLEQLGRALVSEKGAA